LLVRHSEGSHNIKLKEAFKFVGIHPSKWGQTEVKKFFNFFATEDLLDARLTEKGVQ
jgi:hypothetical protein